ncbi:hypothetical protein [Gordonia sp. GN26]
MTAVGWAYLLHSVALVLQIAGAVLVALDIKQSQDNTTRFKKALDRAEEIRNKHVSVIGSQPRSVPSPFGGTIRIPQVATAAREQIADQVGPSATAERKALTSFVREQYEVSKVRRWLGVGLLVLGIAVGFAANVVAL